ncbi:hypothetical protein ACTXOR_06430 [Arthrobacter rhombi]|uniref:hypothetical protein n=1 Tax=Arthrobacter rhombi TaxID=71253 RepID=UPI003FD59F0A
MSARSDADTRLPQAGKCRAKWVALNAAENAEDDAKDHTILNRDVHRMNSLNLRMSIYFD